MLLSRATFDVLYKAFINTHSRNLGAWHFEQNFSLFLECHAAVLNSYRYIYQVPKYRTNISTMPCKHFMAISFREYLWIEGVPGRIFLVTFDSGNQDARSCSIDFKYIESDETLSSRELRDRRTIIDSNSSIDALKVYFLYIHVPHITYIPLKLEKIEVYCTTYCKL